MEGRTVKLDGVVIDSKTYAKLSNFLAHDQQITCLELSRNGISDVDGLSSALKNNTTLLELRLCSNPIRSAGLACLSAALATNRTLTSLELEDVFINDEHFFSPLLANRTLQRLSLRDNFLSDGALRSIASSSMPITSLDMGHNAISAAGVGHLVARLRRLGNLCLAENAIGPDGCNALAESLSAPDCSLTSLDLGKCSIGDCGAQMLANSLVHSTTLQQLRLYSNELTVDGAIHIGAALNENFSLLFLDLHDNRLGSGGKK
jgi:Ran GTPase-activating protein (RanGAP) involved in mRNA processing and transport